MKCAESCANSRILGIRRITRQMEATMKQNTLIAATSALTIALSSLTATAVQAADTAINAQELETLKVQLIEAKTAVENAQQVAEEIVQTAQADADRILEQANATANQSKEDKISPLAVKNAAVAVEIAAGTIEEIATAIMPEGWRILVDVKDPKIKDRRFQYVTTKAREQALSDLLNSIDMSHQYFFELVNADGEASPLLVISKR